MAPQFQAHWDRVYKRKANTEVSWYEERPTRSLELIRASGVRQSDAIIDVGGGAARLVDELLLAGYNDLTVLDISAEVLVRLRERLGAAAERVALVREDITAFRPARRYALWHDRAVFHFLVEREDRARYVETLRRALEPDGHLILATFGPQGPQRCSDLPVERYDHTALAAEVGKEFRLLDWSLVVHRTPRGVEQQFLYCRFARSGD
jgi:SAM-dependent methyltransferase